MDSRYCYHKYGTKDADNAYWYADRGDTPALPVAFLAVDQDDDAEDYGEHGSYAVKEREAERQ